MKELEEEFEKHSGGPPAPTRCLRSQQMAAAVVEVASGGGGGGGEEERFEQLYYQFTATLYLVGGGAAAAVPQVEEIDPYDLLEAVDVLAKMPKDFYERIVSVMLGRTNHFVSLAVCCLCLLMMFIGRCEVEGTQGDLGSHSSSSSVP